MDVHVKGRNVDKRKKKPEFQPLSESARGGKCIAHADSGKHTHRPCGYMFKPLKKTESNAIILIAVALLGIRNFVQLAHWGSRFAATLA